MQTEHNINLQNIIEQLKLKSEQLRKDNDEVQMALNHLTKVLINDHGLGILDIGQESSTAQKMIIGQPLNYNFTGTIRDAIQSFNGREFTIAEIEAELLKHVTCLPRNPRSRIAMVLQGFIKKREVSCSFKGGGSIPHRYREGGNTKPMVTNLKSTDGLNGHGHVSQNSWQSPAQNYAHG